MLIAVIFMNKKCTRCGIIKDSSDFYPCPSAKSGFRFECKQCTREKNYLDKYGITLSEYDELFEKQGGVCFICGRSNLDGRRLFVDHNHSTGEVRGLLCQFCNIHLGWYEDNKHKIDQYLS